MHYSVQLSVVQLVDEFKIICSLQIIELLLIDKFRKIIKERFQFHDCHMFEMINQMLND